MYWQWKNPYTDEIHEERELVNVVGVVIGRTFTFKRTWKNGKIAYIRKTISN